MTARAFLVRGLLCGLLAGLAAFATAFYVGEPHVQAAIEVEEAAATAPPAGSAAADDHGATDHGGDDHAADGHTHEEGGTVVSRDTQRTWGLLTGSVGIGTALGGLVALVSAAVVGRIGSLRPGQSTALVALVGWVAVALVPFVKYPATPPAVGDPDTIGARTGLFFLFTAISVGAAVLGVLLARRVLTTSGSYAAVVAGVAVYLAIVVVVGQVLPTVNEVGTFPADTLWFFRRASLMTTATIWAVIGVLLTGAVGRLAREHTSRVERRELAASL